MRGWVKRRATSFRSSAAVARHVAGRRHHRIIEWLRLEGVFEDQLAPIPLPWAGTSLSTSGCPGPHSTRPWTPPGTGHLHIHDFSFWYILELNAAHPSSWSGIHLCSLLHNGSFDVLGVLRRLHNWLKDLSLLQMSNKWCFLFLFSSSYYVLVLQV